MNSKDDIKEHVGQDRMSATEDCQRLKSMEEAYAQSSIEKGWDMRYRRIEIDR